MIILHDKLTIFYNKRTGTIKELCSGIQDMSWFGEEKEDYELIFDYIVVDFDSYILENHINMYVENGEVKAREIPIPKKYL